MHKWYKVVMAGSETSAAAERQGLGSFLDDRYYLTDRENQLGVGQESQRAPFVSKGQGGRHIRSGFWGPAASDRLSGIARATAVDALFQPNSACIGTSRI